MTRTIDFIRNITAGLRSNRFGHFGWAVTMPEETDALASLTSSANLSNKCIGVIRGENGATTFSWTQLLGKADYAPRILHEWDFSIAILPNDPDAVVIDGSSFADRRLDHFIFQGMLSGYHFVLMGTEADYASPGGERLLGVLEAFHNCEENGVWWGNDFTRNLEQHARDFNAAA